jgi:hypothetical protein
MGCCDAMGNCVQPPNNGNNTTCGFGGLACADCSANNQLCVGFGCTSPGGGSAGGGGAGGGGAGGGGAMICDGCLLPNGSCAFRGTSQQNNNICGSNAQMCVSCVGAASVCSNGACVAPPATVGSPCASDASCQTTLGPTAVCKQQNLNGSITYSSGYCSIPRCAPSGFDLCPMGSACLNFPRIFSEEQTFCYATGCGTSNPCRPGYLCFNLGGSMTGCLPSDLNNPSLTLDTTSVVGQACTFNSECRAPTPGAPVAGGVCLPELQRQVDGGIVQVDGGPVFTGNPGGQCTRDCRIDEDCTSNGQENLAEGLCLGVSQTLALCYRGCAGPNTGQSNCRPGYVCEQLRLSDGGTLSTGYCDGRCDLPGSSCGTYTDGGTRACLPNGYCDFPRPTPFCPDAGALLPDGGC